MSEPLRPLWFLIKGSIHKSDKTATYVSMDSISRELLDSPPDSAEARGNDLNNLMDALGELRKLYTLQYWL
jgi:hypothetical protein